MNMLTETEFRDAIAYQRAYLKGDVEALEVLARHGNHEQMMLALAAIFAGHLLHAFRDDRATIDIWLENILTRAGEGRS